MQELGSLLEKAERKRVQELLKQEQKKVEKELATKRQQKEQQARREADPSSASKPAYTVKITSYGMGPVFTKTQLRFVQELQKIFKVIQSFVSFVQLGTSRRNLSKSTLR